MGVPQSVILLVGILFLIVGIGTIALLLPLAGVERDDPFWVKLLILVIGFCSFMVVRLIHSFLVSPEYILENLIPLVFSLLLAGSIVLIHKPLSRAVTRVIAAKSYVVGGSEVALALILGMSMFLIQAAVLN